MLVCSWIESDRDESGDYQGFGNLKEDVHHDAVDPGSKLPSPSFTPKQDRFSFDVSGRTTRNMVDFSMSNKDFQYDFHSGDLPAPPARKIAIVTCMDARMHPEKFLGLRFGDAHVIRNAGGRISEDALRSLVVSQRMLGTEEVVVIHHTQCGKFTSLCTSCCSICWTQGYQSLEQAAVYCFHGTLTSLSLGSIRHTQWKVTSLCLSC